MSRRPSGSKPVVCLLGESTLVGEYAASCAAGGYAVQQTLLHDAGRSVGKRFGLPRGIRIVARPSRTVDLALELTNTSREAKRKNLLLLGKTLRHETPIISSSVTVTLAEQSRWVRNPERLVGIAALPTLLGGNLMEFATTSRTNEESRLSARRFAESLSKGHAFVQDSAGMVLPRIICCLANEAYFALAEGVASPTDIDNAMRLGTNYPAGPLEWAQKIGLRQVLAVMQSMQEFFGEDRYRPAPALRIAAEAEAAGNADA